MPAAPTRISELRLGTSQEVLPDGGFTAPFWGVFPLHGHDVLPAVQLKSLLEWENSALGSGLRKRVKDNLVACPHQEKLTQQVFIACLL